MTTVPPAMGADEYLVTSEIAAITRIPEETLRRWRNLPGNPGPKSLKHGPKLVVYLRSEAVRWLGFDLGEDEYLTTADVAAMTRIPEPTLRRWRNSKNNPGPASTTLGTTLVRYRRSEVERWKKAQQDMALAS